MQISFHIHVITVEGMRPAHVSRIKHYIGIQPNH